MVVRIALGLSLSMLLAVTPTSPPAVARDDVPAAKPKPKPALPGEDWPESFVPRSPRTAEDRRQREERQHEQHGIGEQGVGREAGDHATLRHPGGDEHLVADRPSRGRAAGDHAGERVA